MPQPTTSLSLTDFRSWAGFRLGYGRDYDASTMDDEQQAQIDDVIGVACRMVHVPVGDNDRSIPAGYVWTWLEPIITLTLEEDAQYVDLPDDFQGFIGKLQLQQDGLTSLGELDCVNAAMILQRYDLQPNNSGRPGCFAVQPLKGTSATGPNKYRLWVWPAADGAYTLQGQYVLAADALSVTRPHPYGGAALAEVYRQAVLAACEKEIYRGERGDEYANFLDVLAAAVARDQQKREQSLGYVGDASDDRFYKGKGFRHYQYGNPAQYDGTTWD